MKKFLALILALVMALSLVACGNDAPPADDGAADDGAAPAVKVGFICLHDENSTYDLNFLNGAKEAIANLGLTEADYIIKTNVPESSECYETAMDLVDDGCNIIFANSFGHEPYMLQAAQEVPDVEFCHSTGTLAHTAGVPNYHNAFASIYEGRFLAGVAAGMKLNEMIEAGEITADQAKMGYVGAFTYAEVVSGYSSFYLGAKSVCPSVTMEVTFTGSWYDEALEKEGAQKLIDRDCVLISQHADSLGAPTACENAGVPNVSYNGSTQAAGPNTYIISSRINWAPYYEFAINAVKNGETIPADWTGTLATGSVVLEPINDAVAAPGTAEKIADVQAALEAGTLHVYDCSTFTCTISDTVNPFKVDTLKLDGEGYITSYMADVDTDEAYAGDTEVIDGGVFYESKFRSAPYFDLEIDGITRLDTKM